MNALIAIVLTLIILALYVKGVAKVERLILAKLSPADREHLNRRSRLLPDWSREPLESNLLMLWGLGLGFLTVTFYKVPGESQWYFNWMIILSSISLPRLGLQFGMLRAQGLSSKAEQVYVLFYFLRIVIGLALLALFSYLAGKFIPLH